MDTSLLAGLLVFYLLSQVQCKCNTTQVFKWENETHLNVSDLGIAALKDNDTYALELIGAGCDVNHQSTVDNAGSQVTGLTPLLIATKYNSLKVIRLLTSLPGINLEAQDGIGRTAVHLAVSRGYVHSLQILGEAGADLDISNNNGSTPLFKAVTQGQEGVVETLISLGAKIHGGWNSTEQVWEYGAYHTTEKNVQIPPIYAAAETGNAAIVNLLITAGADVNATVRTSRHFFSTFSHKYSTLHRCTPLHAAVVNNHTETVQTLLDAGSAASYPLYWYKPNWYNYPLHLAARNGDQDIVKLLVAAGAELDQDSKIRGEFTPAYEAAKEGHTDILRILHIAGANLSLVDEGRHAFSALHIAAALGHSETVRTLLELGVPVNQVTWKDGEGTALSAALTWSPNGLQSSNIQTVQVLVDHGAHLNLTTNYGQGLIFDILNRRGANIDFVKFLLETGEIDINKPARFMKDAPLTVAVKKGHLEIAKYLVSVGADVNHASDPLRSATNMMSQYNSRNCSNTTLGMVEFLLQHGAMEMSSENQESCLYLAAGSGCLNLVKLFVKNGANVKNSNALFASATLDITKYLVEKGVNIHLTTDERKTALCEAAARGKLEIVKYLVESGAEVNLTTDEGKTALYEAAARGKLEIVKYLVEYGAEVNLERQSLLFAAAEPGVNKGSWTWTMETGPIVETVKTIINLGGRIQFITKNNESMLSERQMAVYFANAEIVRHLLDCGAVDVNVRTEEGTTALMFASTLNSIQNLEVVKVLMAAGVDVDAVDKNGETVIHKIIRNRAKYNRPGDEGYPKILDYLVRVGGASLNIPDRHGVFPIQEGFYVEQLMGLGAWVNVTTDDGNNLLHLGIEPVETIIANGVDLDARNIMGETPLFKAESLVRVKKLVEAGADLNIANNDEKTVVFTVGLSVSLEYLVGAGAAIVLNTTQGPLSLTYELGAARWTSYLGFSANNRLYDLIEFLVARGGNVDAMGSNGLTAFQKSVLDTDTGSQFLIQKAHTLLAAGADIDALAKDGRTALINATRNQNRNTIMFLIREGADVNKTDSDNKTALSHALDIHKKNAERLELRTSWKIIQLFTFNNIDRRIPDILNLLKIIQILVDKGSDVSDVDLHERVVIDLAMLGDKQKAVLEYFIMVSEEYYEDADLRTKIEENIKEYCSWYEFKELCQCK